MAKLFTADIDKKLFEQYKFGGDLSKQEVVAKIFNPYGSGTWYLLNSDPQDPDYIWAIVDLFDVEIGSVSRNDLETMKVPPFELHLERDKFFQPMNAQILYLRLRGGEKFEEGGTTDCGCQHRMEDGGAMDYKNKFGLVKVKFKNPKYNYSTNVSADTTEKDARKYFVGQMFNVGSYPREIMREVVDIEFYEKGTYAEGGEIANSNNEMLQSQLKAVEHHAKELSSIVTDKTPVEAWVVGKIERASTDLSDITHYLDGQKFESGGELIDVSHLEDWELKNKLNTLIKEKEIGNYDEKTNQLAVSIMNEINKRQGEQLNKSYAKGGSIKNQYAGKTADKVWDEWTWEQKYHFIKDHHTKPSMRPYFITANDYSDIAATKFNQIPIGVQNTVATHIDEGQYAKGGTIEKDTPILVGMIAENVARYKYFEKNNVPKQNEPQLIKKADETIAKLEKHLEQKANTVYKNNEMFKKQLNQKGNKGRDALYMYMEHWADAFLGKGYAKGGTMANGGILPKSEFTIQEIKEHLLNEFPDSFSFALYPLKRDTKHTPDYDAVKSYKGLMDSEIKGKLKFPQYKPTHSINYGISQGGENTYFEFLLETKEDYYVGTFGFKDEGDVPANYITKFLAFLQKSYGLPFEIIHEVMAKGGVTYNTGRSWHQDRARYNKSEDWEKPFSERKMAMGGGMDEFPYKSNIIVENEKYAKIVIKRHNGRILDETKEGNEYNFLVGSFDWKVLEEILQELKSKNILKSHYAKGGKINKKYAYFALGTSDNKILNAWEIVDDVESLKYYAKLDMKDMDFKPSDYKLLSKAALIRQGIDPFNVDSWRKNEYADGEMMANGGEVMKHKHYDYITIELIEPTNKGWKVKQIETHSTLGKKLSKPKEKIAFFTKDEIKELFQPTMAMGGEVKFSDKVKAVKASLLKTKKVSPKVQKDYGKTYSPKEAEQAAKRIVGSRTAKWNERISNNK